MTQSYTPIGIKVARCDDCGGTDWLSNFLLGRHRHVGGKS